MKISNRTFETMFAIYSILFWIIIIFVLTWICSDSTGEKLVSSDEDEAIETAEEIISNPMDVEVEEEDMPLYIEALHSNNETVSKAAESILLSLAETAVQPLIDDLTSTPPREDVQHTHLRTQEVLVKQQELAIDPLIVALKHEDRIESKKRLIDVLSKCSEVKAYDELFGLLSNQNSPQIQEKVIEVLSKSDHIDLLFEYSSECIIKKLTSINENIRTRLNCAIVLGYMSNDIASAPLIKTLNENHSDELNVEIIRCLGKIGGKDVIQVLKRLVHSKSLHNAAMQSLARLGEIDFLIKIYDTSQYKIELLEILDIYGVEHKRFRKFCNVDLSSYDLFHKGSLESKGYDVNQEASLDQVKELRCDVLLVCNSGSQQTESATYITNFNQAITLHGTKVWQSYSLKTSNGKVLWKLYVSGYRSPYGFVGTSVPLDAQSIVDKKARKIMIERYEAIIDRKLKEIPINYKTKKGKPSKRFIDNGDGKITDTVKKAMWQKGRSKKQFTHKEALEYARQLRLGNHSNWRLPSISDCNAAVNFEFNVRNNDNRQFWTHEGRRITYKYSSGKIASEGFNVHARIYARCVRDLSKSEIK